MLQETFGTKKPIIAMVHFPPLPSTPLYDKTGGMQGVIDAAVKDIEALQAGGVDCIMFGNEGDRPYVTKATPATLAAMSFAVGQLKSLIKVPFGVNYLWDPVATVALAVASGARFAREIFTGVYASDMGLWVPNAMEAQRLKVECGRADLKLLYNINAEFAAPVGERAITARAKSAVFAGLADVVLVSGPMTGEAVETGELKRVKDVLPKTPVFANTGCNIDNIGDILRIGDGAVVGTHFKVDGNTWNAVDKARVARFMDKVRSLR